MLTQLAIKENESLRATLADLTEVVLMGVSNMSETKKRLYAFLVEMNRMTAEEYKTITGESYTI